MTVGEWLHARTPRPPAALTARLEVVLADSLREPSERVPEMFLAAAERVVAELLRNDNTSRDSALDLLTADALLTYAFEAAGREVSTISQRATEAMTRIAALGDTGLARA